ncbi:MAG: 5-oxoprolinase subunit PxpB [Xanthobacteraceae bacterium]
MCEYKVLPAGDTALIIEFGDRINRQFNDRVLALSKRLQEAAIDGVTDVVPTFRSLMVQYEPLVVSSARLIARIRVLAEELETTDRVARGWRLPVCYDPLVAADLAEVAATVGLSPWQLVERHSAVSYRVYMLGFLPGQAYMGDVPEELALPRRAAPRPKIPAGSLAMAMTMTSIFPRETPCGWHIIGRSPVCLWDVTRSAMPLLAPGDIVRFVPVTLREYEALVAKATAGALALSPDTAGAAA